MLINRNAIALNVRNTLVQFGALKPVVESLDEVDEAFHNEYKKGSDGKYILDIDGVPRGFVERSKLDEFRDNNTKLKEEVEKWEGKFKDVDPDKYYDLLDKEDKLNTEKMVEAGKVDEIVDQKVQKVKEDATNQVNNAKTEMEKAQKRAEQSEARLASLAIQTEAGRELENVDTVRLRKGAFPDFITRVQNTFHYEDGQLVARDVDGNARYNKESDPLTVRDFIGELVESAPHLFEESKGGGAGSSTGNQGGNEGVRKLNRGSELSSEDIESLAEGKASF